MKTMWQITKGIRKSKTMSRELWRWADRKLDIPGAINMGGDSRGGSEEIQWNLMKVEPCTAIETRVVDISTGEVGGVDLHRLNQKRKEEIEAWNWDEVDGWDQHGKWAKGSAWGTLTQRRRGGKELHGGAEKSTELGGDKSRGRRHCVGSLLFRVLQTTNCQKSCRQSCKFDFGD